LARKGFEDFPEGLKLRKRIEGGFHVPVIRGPLANCLEDHHSIPGYSSRTENPGEKVHKDELEMAAREHGIEDLKNVELAVLEIDGSISIIPYSEHHVRVKRKLKAMRHR
jgi:hypothetical protein